MRTKSSEFGKLAGLGVVGAAGYLALRPFCLYGREALVLLAPPVLGACLLLFWPRTRRVKLQRVAAYVPIMLAIIAAAVVCVSRVAGGRVIWTEVLLCTYFAFGWRLAWEIWSRTVGRVGQRYVRLMRRRWRLRRTHSLTTARAIGSVILRWLIPAGRIAMTAFIFVPFFVSMVCTLRLKIGNSFDPQSYAGMPFEDANFMTSDGLELHGWYLPGRGAESAVVICHGLGANKGNFFEFVRLFYGQGYNVLIFDLRGHGDSDGHTSGMGLLEDRDVLAAVRWLKQTYPGGARHVYGLGSSMGAAALLRAARQTNDIEALILDSCYSSAEILADQHVRAFPVIGPLFAEIAMAFLSLQLGENLANLDPLDAIGQLGGRPVLLIHATNDVIIPPENIELLFARAELPKAKWLGPGTHSNVLTEDFTGYQHRVLRFLADVSNGTSADRLPGGPDP